MAAEGMLESLSNRLLDLDSHIKVSAEETYSFIESKKNQSTVKKTKSDLKRLKEWLVEEGETRDLEDIASTELDMFLSRFFLSAKNLKTRKDLEPSTLQGINASVRRYLIEKNYPVDPTTHRDFKHSRDTLKAKAVDLKEKGLGNRSRRADPFTSEEVETLYDKDLLGAASPKALITTLWFNNTMHLGLRGRQEHITMLWGDLEPKSTSEGRQFLEYTERATKTRKRLSDDPRMFKPKIFEQKGDPQCPVQLYLFYKSKRPTLDPESRFYLTVNRHWEQQMDKWYTMTPMGKETLGSLAKVASEKAGFQVKLKNIKQNQPITTYIVLQQTTVTKIWKNNHTSDRNVDSTCVGKPRKHGGKGNKLLL